MEYPNTCLLHLFVQRLQFSEAINKLKVAVQKSNFNDLGLPETYFFNPPLQKPQFTSAIDALKKTVAAEGAKGLYKGMGAPLATVAVFNAVLFTVRGQMESLLRSKPGEQLTVGQQFVAGSGAGVGAALIACPTELIKCRLQVG